MNEVVPSEYKETGSFQYWCCKVLPLVYEDSLSYYELLCKLVKAIADAIANVDGVRTDITKLIDAYNTLREYVDHYFDSLDVSKEVNAKLDEMASDGTLAEIINDQIFADLKSELEDKISRVPFNPDDANKSAYIDASVDAVVSYFAAGVGLDSVVGTSNVFPKTAYVYTDGNKGYMGVLGQGDGFVYTDTKSIGGVEYPVSYIDCSQFVSLITKCRNYENSPYKYAFENKDNINTTTLRDKCLELGKLDEAYYTFDFFNYIYSARMAYIMNASGNQVRVVSSKTTPEDVNLTDYVNHLEDGDIIFVGNPVAYTDRYLGCHHIALYFKTLDKLNEYGAKYNIQFRDIDNGYRAEYGYIVHATGTTGEYSNTLRINSFYNYANTLPTNGTKIIYSCKPYSNALNSNKARRAISYMFSEYDKFGFGYRNGTWNYISSDENDEGRMRFQQIGYVGGRMADNQDLDTIKDGYYRVTSSALRDSIKNAPDFTGLYFDLVTIGSDAGTTTGVQMAVSSYGELAYRRKKVDSSEWNDWALYRGFKQDKVARGFVEFGTVPAGSKVTKTVALDSYGFTSPRVVTSLKCDKSWATTTQAELAITLWDVTSSSFTITAVNNSSNSAYIGAYWVAVDSE